MLEKSPIALRCLKAALNADCDGQAGLQELAGNATLLYYMTEEAQEGRDAFLEKRKPDFKQLPPAPLTVAPTGGAPRVPLAARPRGLAPAARPTLAAAVGPVLVGTAPRGGTARSGAGRRAAALARRASRSRSAPTSRTTSSTSRRAPTPPERIGPPRVLAIGLAHARGDAPRDDRRASRAATLAGLPGRVGGWPIVAIGVASIAAGIAYTGGPLPARLPRPRRLFVFAFFGLVAVCGTSYVQPGDRPARGARGAPGRRARDRDPGRQQPARRRDRSRARQAHARGASAPGAARAENTLGCSRSPTRSRWRLARRRDQPAAAPPAPHRPARARQPAAPSRRGRTGPSLNGALVATARLHAASVPSRSACSRRSAPSKEAA